MLSLMYVEYAPDFHLPYMHITLSDIPTLDAWVAAPILTECDLKC